jgi:uncharacterized protein YcaQ
MRGFLDPKEAWFKGWGEKYGSYLEPVKKRIREEGPLAARDFENPGDRGKGPWWDWKPAKAALELLFWRGALLPRRGPPRLSPFSLRQPGHLALSPEAALRLRLLP